MNINDDDEDKFLYGSDIEDVDVTNKRSITDQNDYETIKRQKFDDKQDNGIDGAASDISDVSDTGNDESDEESDSDVEIIIGTGTDSSKLDSKSIINGGPAPISSAEGLMDANIPTISSNYTESRATLDLNSIGDFEGQPITDIDPEVLKQKPWRQPGSNLSDYFNYGFNEQTWMEYLHRQDHLRQDYNPQKILVGLMTLQQQGKLHDSSKDLELPTNTSVVPNSTSINSSAIANPSVPPGIPPPGFPPMGMPPMFGGFPPFPFPGMMNSINNMNNQSNM